MDKRLDRLEEGQGRLEEGFLAVQTEQQKVRIHLENHTDKAIKLLAENFIELTNKLNVAIPATDKTLAYEVKVDYAILELEQLKKEFHEFKAKSA